MPPTERSSPERESSPIKHLSDRSSEREITPSHCRRDYWRDFAQKLPAEEKANAARMMNIAPKLLNDTTFEVGVDNNMVEKYMQELLPTIQSYLREHLHNRKITMTVRVLEAKEMVRAYSHTERFQMMSQKNPKLLKLKEVFGLELS